MLKRFPLYLSIALLDSMPAKAQTLSLEIHPMIDCRGGPEGRPPPPMATICFSPEVIVSSLDFTEVRHLKTKSGDNEIVFTLTPQGRERLSAYSSNNIGHRMAVVLDGHILSTPVITQPLRGPTFVISGPLSSTEVEAIVDRFKHDKARGGI